MTTTAAMSAAFVKDDDETEDRLKERLQVVMGPASSESLTALSAPVRPPVCLSACLLACRRPVLHTACTFSWDVEMGDDLPTASPSSDQERTVTVWTGR